MAISQIKIKYGGGYPGTVLDLAEPAFDISSGYLYIGKGIGQPPIIFYPTFDGSSYIFSYYATNASVNNALTYYVTDASLQVISGGYY